jgi:hypothetical protein
VVVGNAPDGATSLAAVAVDVGDTGSAVVVLRGQEAGGSLQAAAAVRVCTTSDQWTSTTGGSLDSAPHPDCQGAVDAARDSSDLWTADVTKLVARRTGIVSLMLVPGASPLFEVQLARPDVTGTAAAAPPSEAPPPIPATETPSAAASPTDAAPPLFAPTRTPLALASPPPAAATASPVGPTAPTAAPPASTPPGAPTDLAARRGAGAGHGSRLGRLLLFIVVSSSTGTVAGLAYRWRGPALGPA